MSLCFLLNYLFVLTTIISTCVSDTGIDISSPLNSTIAGCLYQVYKPTFMIFRGYTDACAVDENVCSSMNSAVDYSTDAKRDVYFVPSPKCSKTAEEQLNELVDYLQSNCGNFLPLKLWLDVTDSESEWFGDQSQNRKWYESLVDACETLVDGEKIDGCGIHTSVEKWKSVFGSGTYCYGKGLPLWYTQINDDPSYKNYSPFACWLQPSAKQYSADIRSSCGPISVNLDYSVDYE